MKNLKLIYNPFSGDKSFKSSLDECIETFQSNGYNVDVHRTTGSSSVAKHISLLPKDYYDALVVSGGDGSINLAINAMMKNNLDIPLGIIPSGTANDFARYLKIPTKAKKAAEIILHENIITTDLGIVNDEFYFINVCAAGMLTNISQKIDINLKNTFGKLAYYAKGVEQLPNFIPMHVRITNSKEIIEENIYLFFLLNSSGTGGFDKLSPSAKINDGLFDFIAFKDFPIVEIPLLFVKVLSGDYLDDSRILFFRDKYIKVECMDEETEHLVIETDIDGETGPDLPIEIKNLNNSFQIFATEDYNIPEKKKFAKNIEKLNKKLKIN